MTSEVQTRYNRKTHFVAMEPAAVSGSSGRFLHHNHHQTSASNNGQTTSGHSGQQNASSSNNLIYSSGNNNNRRNTVVKQFGDNKQQASGDLFNVGGNHSSQAESKERDEIDVGKNHVGPVMGIFFKVWSLVKVTKVRHQNKMRRQNSEDASHFQYVSGDQLPGGGSHPRPALLQDRHFRRAGSQPAPSTSGLGCSTTSDSYQQQQQPMSWLQVGSPTTASGPGHFGPHSSALANTTTTGTSSTSSGVSSTSSCVGQTLAGTGSSGNQTPSPPAPGSSRRQPSLYNSRRSTADVLVPATKAKAGANQKSNSSWATKIKRSATTVNQTDFSSYVSRYRFRRDQTPTNVIGRHKESAGSSAGQQSYFSRDTTPVHESEPRLYNNYSDKNNNLDDDEEATSNDIYSTPNDSIQSVPSTDPVISSEKLAHGVSVARSQPQQSQAHPITKSFSTSSFNQLLKQQQQQNQRQKFTPIHESTAPAMANEGDKSNTSCQTGPDHSRWLYNNTRFFLSSSSSEDSTNNQSALATGNPASNTPNLNETKGGEQLDGGGSSNSNNSNSNSNSNNNNQSSALLLDQAPRETPLEQQQQQVSLQQGVHCHVLQAQRPDTLFVHSQPGPYPMPVSLLTPAARRGLALPLGSPLDCLPVSCAAPLVDLAAHRMQPPPMHHHPAAHNNSYLRSGYRKSPSLLEISSNGHGPLPARGLSSRFSSKYPIQSNRVQLGQPSGVSGAAANNPVAPPYELPRAHDESTDADDQLAPPAPIATSSAPSSNLQQSQQQPSAKGQSSPTTNQMPNSISLHDCKLTSQTGSQLNQRHQPHQRYPPIKLLDVGHASALWPDTQAELVGSSSSEYKLAQMLLESGSNPSAKDGNGYTVLMHAVLSDNLPAVKCLVEHGADLNETNAEDQSVLDLVCNRPPTRGRLELLKLLIDHRADMDRARKSDGTRLLDRLIDEHRHCADKLPFIDCLLQNGAKLGSSTWLAASEKYEIQLRLLQKLCQDGYFLYKKSSIEAAVYRFEYALKRLAELEQQLARNHFHHPNIGLVPQNFIPLAARQIKYQTYLGLSRCERKRKFYKRALEFAHLAILVDSTSYEGYYSKAHILKDIGDIDDALLAIDQTHRLVVKSIENLELALNDLQHQEEASLFDGCFSRLDQRRSNWIECSRLELSENLDYMLEAKRFVSRLRAEIMDDKLRGGGASIAIASLETDEPQTTTSH